MMVPAEAKIFHFCLQHFQLLMQTFVLVRFEPSLQFLSRIAAQAIVSKLILYRQYQFCCTLAGKVLIFSMRLQ